MRKTVDLSIKINGHAAIHGDDGASPPRRRRRLASRGGSAGRADGDAAVDLNAFDSCLSTGNWTVLTR
jgi:hypothetical protein